MCRSRGGATDDYAYLSFVLKIASIRRSSGGGVLLEPDFDSTIAGMEALVEGRSGTNPGEARAWIAQNFTWAKVTEKLASLFGS